MAGRPTEYSEEMAAEAWNYITMCTDTLSKDNRLTVNLPSIEGLAMHLEVSRSTVYLWQKEHPQFSDILEVLLQKQAQALLNNGLSGSYNSTIAKLILTKHGYSDKTEVDQKTVVKDERIDPTSLTEDELRILAEIQRKSRTSQKEGS
jgi:hypothetical protein